LAAAGQFWENDLIGDFLFSDTPLDSEIMIHLEFDEAGRRQARMTVPAEIELEMPGANYPDAPEIMSVESALAFGLVLAVRSGRSLVLTGDPSVWTPDWGVLLEARISTPLATPGR
jgi:hypothetical protein